VFHTARISDEKKLLFKVAELETELSTSRGKAEEAEKTVTRLENNARVKYGKFNVAITKLNRKLSDTHAAHHLKVAELEAELEAALS
jgi:undecaprenyl pyrophosphate synthase